MKENDLRVIKTRKALSSSLYQLLEQRLFQSITVNQICDNALVHRTTFYKHFYDKYDLLEYLFNELAKGFFAADIKQRLHHPFQTMNDNISNKEELQKIANLQEEDAEFNKALKNVCINVMKKDIKNNISRIKVDDTIPDNLIYYIYGGLLDGFMAWIKNEDITMSPQDIDLIFNKSITLKIED
ncbi:TetR/AcrR family transcriptional regulator [Staphylococcus simiae]|uniref:TetR/AcrR family transcriptional regulator n=1 Tax=Staphylococcus simiae TaxID=308354 RepID=UPI001A962B0B|nr:TetR/AcrR family transcriptional regulator [Staphylococcus simiae]MBO1198172.1 TetR/AcrR family transcriptional regulator [Staphylococcus simiae]MBO1200284.1 TetR/AcrR family transcriptional regulator [Staphylococcus simiae]MBO1202552.1 TetR/AcrR family transcriptional regulator [Staphylococcus simiae]MBO1210170.1 TetR/AcrR family transcriptional regulator [Staphylococcus simiae]MBO1228696.1 TetR/AcrR family transcriptional regulator [Staphylococcus simiae]